jgi:FMN reductase
MTSVLVLTGSPSATSRTAVLAAAVAARLGQAHDVRVVRLRDLPPAALLGADTSCPQIADVVRAVADADGVVVATPIYKAAYSGLLKTLLDLLPQTALAGKAVLPLVTGGTPAHVLALDYALRPVLTSLGADHVLPGRFVLDRHIEVGADGVRLDDAAEGPLWALVATFSDALHARAPLAAAP